MKYRIYPNNTQIQLIEKHFGSTRFLYNYFLDYRQKEYAKGNKKVGYIVTQAELTKLKKLDEYDWLNECGSQSLQMALRDLDSAYSRFFKKQGGYPKFKSKKHTTQSFTAPQNIKVANNRVYLPKFTKDGIKVKLHREIPKEAMLKQATISRQNNQRKDTLHKISNEITNQYDIICLETLNVKGMIKNRRLAKSIADVAWSEFMRQLEYKAQWRGKTVLKIDQWFPSSQICSHCGASTGKKPLNIRKFDCPTCSKKDIDRDINASVNIKNYGLGQVDNRNTVGTIGI